MRWRTLMGRVLRVRLCVLEMSTAAVPLGGEKGEMAGYSLHRHLAGDFLARLYIY